ncbi:unnamed protein product [Meganyctiphanes norvegica]|uniref:C2H2-type domain-containing protein n=1 Tax=Meganyctiphanes norvegica TaxID=48144 RepID=A0AAV2RI45_MEGNR
MSNVNMFNHPQKLKESNVRLSHLGVVEKPFQCTQCDSRFTTNAAKNIHSKIHSVDQVFACSVCSYKTKYYKELRKHTFDKCSLKVRVPKILNCHEYFRQVHMRQVDTTCVEFGCTSCDVVCNSQMGLKIHITKQHLNQTNIDGSQDNGSDNEYECAVCDFTCNSLLLIQVHSLEHNSEDDQSNIKSYDVDKKVGGQKDILGYNEKLSCQECDFQCLTPRGIQVHVDRQHPKQKKVIEKLSCKICEFQCFTKSGIQGHMAEAHPKEVLRVIPKCMQPVPNMSTKYRQTDMLFDPIPIGNHLNPDNEKIRENDVTRMYKCPMCRYKGTLCGFKRHRRIHMQNYYEKTLAKKKTQNEDSYDENAELVTHILNKNHTNGRPFMCTKCKAKFLTSGRLASHMESHESEVHDPEAVIFGNNEDYFEISPDADNYPLGEIKHDNIKRHPEQRENSLSQKNVIDNCYIENYKESEFSHELTPVRVSKRKWIEDMDENEELDISDENTPKRVAKKQDRIKTFRCLHHNCDFSAYTLDDIKLHAKTAKVHRNIKEIRCSNNGRKQQFCLYMGCDFTSFSYRHIKIHEKTHSEFLFVLNEIEDKQKNPTMTI